jgi:hypothetical protein
MNKKSYQPPTVKKVRLVIKNSVLAVCHASPNMDPKSGAVGCSLTPGCWRHP